MKRFIFTILCLALSVGSGRAEELVTSKPLAANAARALEEGDLDQFKRGIDIYAQGNKPLPAKWAGQLLKPDRLDYLQYALDKGLRLPPKANATHADWFCKALAYNNPAAIAALVKAGMEASSYKYFSFGLCASRGALISSLDEPNIALFKAFFEGGTPPDITFNKKPLLLTLIEENKSEHARYLLSVGATADQVYEGKALLEYAPTKEMIDLMEEYGGVEKIADNAHLQRVFPYYLEHNPRRARNIAFSVMKSNPAYGKYLLGLYYESESRRQPERESMGGRSLALIAFREAGELGIADALVKVAEAFESGSVVKPNEAIANEFYFLALARNSGVAQARLIERGKLAAPRPAQSLSTPSLPQRAPQPPEAADSNGSGAWQAVGNIFGVVAGAYLYSQGLQAQQAQANTQTRQAVRTELDAWSEEQRRRNLAQQSTPLRLTCRPNVLGTQLNCQ